MSSMKVNSLSDCIHVILCLGFKDPAFGPLPVVSPEPKHFEIMSGSDETQQAITTVLPEEVVVDLLSEKIMVWASM